MKLQGFGESGRVVGSYWGSWGFPLHMTTFYSHSLCWLSLTFMLHWLPIPTSYSATHPNSSYFHLYILHPYAMLICTCLNPHQQYLSYARSLNFPVTFSLTDHWWPHCFGKNAPDQAITYTVLNWPTLQAMLHVTWIVDLFSSSWAHAKHYTEKISSCPLK